jgi:hypothetical protein
MDPGPQDPYVFGPPGSASGSVSQTYGSEDLHPDPHQNVRIPVPVFFLLKFFLVTNPESNPEP